MPDLVRVARRDGSAPRGVRIGSGRRDCLFESKGMQGDGRSSYSGRDACAVAADKFKGSLTAVQVAEQVTAGLRRVVPVWRSRPCPSRTAATARSPRRSRPVRTPRVRVTGPLGEPVTAAYALRDGTAVVEMAEASGLRHLPAGVFAPLTATTYGSGELLRAALDAGARTIVFGVGGSATTDGGAGMLAALGARFLDADGEPVGPGGGGARATWPTADLSGLDPRLADVELVLASDVDNPLTGPKGAPRCTARRRARPDGRRDARRGARPLRVRAWARAGRDASPGAGAAGGIGYGALVALGATLPPRHRGHARRPRLRAALARADARDHRRGLARRADPARQGPGGRRGGGPRARAGGGRGLRPPGAAARRRWARPGSAARTP